MKSLLMSAALAALTFTGPAMAQDNTSSTTSSAPSPNVNVQVDAPAAPAAPVESHTSTTVDKTTVVDRQPSSGGMDSTTLAVLAGIGVIGAAAVFGVAASNRG